MVDFEEGLPFNRNDRQFHFNKIKGEIIEINTPQIKDDNCWCSITLKVGHENTRLVNLCCKQKLIGDVVANGISVGDKVIVLFYLTSRFKNNRWYSTANMLQVDKV